jgi:hypothetical protein
MSKEFLQVLLTAKLAVVGLSLGAAGSSAAPVSPLAACPHVAAYEVVDGECPPAAEFGERGDAQGSGQVCC